ncbi:hypothetical protein GCM10007860_33000 [Chitiniphilus shinanonensis]|uniref:ATPase domain-containing protein n=1 Tax=Chitiniphilus shinanonensis TaxID=553088 RepID=A0ABQ6BWN7_9NEIS|nr:hypothetical protein [Chitiniphilus shinanonensis]GLS06133.1 hypothetical protein GCM10007860_33000 [Chitiniphilus shinanonensis]
MPSTVDAWHFARRELAQRYIDAFRAGLSSARALFARRRMGKTEFLLKDLLPQAEQDGFTCVYVNLWECRGAPLAGIATAVTQQLAARRNPLARLVGKGPHVRGVKLTVLGAGVDARLDDAEVDPTLAQVWQRIDAHPRPILLMIDEAQVLASAEHLAVASALRGGLDVRKERVKVVFTGSSEHTLRGMFGKSSQPFYNWAPVEPFPLLDNLFVSHMVRRANDILRPELHLPDERAQQAFLALKSSPEVFRRFLDAYLLNPFAGVEAAQEAARESTYSDDGFAAAWDSLRPMDRLVLQFVAAGRKGITGKAALREFGQALGIGPAQLHAVNNSLARLMDLKRQILVNVERGEYQFEDLHFQEWVLLEHPPG